MCEWEANRSAGHHAAHAALVDFVLKKKGSNEDEEENERRRDRERRLRAANLKSLFFS